MTSDNPDSANKNLLSLNDCIYREPEIRKKIIPPLMLRSDGLLRDSRKKSLFFAVNQFTVKIFIPYLQHDFRPPKKAVIFN